MQTKYFVQAFSLAAMAAASAAQAQSSVSVYGIVDASVAYAKGQQSKLGVRSGDLVASRLGFRGTEVINPDLKVHFNFEAAINLDTGAGGATNSNNQASGAIPAGSLKFNRQSWVGLEGKWGELRLGRTFNPTFRQYIAYDPFLGGGLGASQAAQSSLATYEYSPAGIRHSNAIEYSLPRGKALAGQLMYASGNNASGAEHRADGNYRAARLTYQWGNANLGVAAGRMSNHALRNVNEVIVGGKYTIQDAHIMAMYTRSKTGLGMHQTGWLLGGIWRDQKMEYRASLSTSSTESPSGQSVGRSDKVAAVAAYHLSKRSSLYLMGAYTRNSRGAASAPLGSLTSAQTGANHNARVVAVGMVHTF